MVRRQSFNLKQRWYCMGWCPWRCLHTGHCRGSSGFEVKG